MRAANIATAIAVACWVALFIMGRDLTFDIYTHGIGIFPNDSQIDFYVLIPVSVALFLAICAWICNIFQGLAPYLAVISCFCFFAVFPYLLLYGGGV